jgi:hypothetical protein
VIALADAVFSRAMAGDVIFAAAGALPAAARGDGSLYLDALAAATVVWRLIRFAVPSFLLTQTM